MACFPVAPPGFSSHEAAEFQTDQPIVVWWPVGRVDVVWAEDQRGAGFKGCPAATSLYHYLISTAFISSRRCAQ